MAKTTGKTKVEKSHTEEKPVIDTLKSLTWSIRDIDMETRMIIAKAAKLNGKTISQYIVDDVRAFAQGQIIQTRQPATSKDMENQVSFKSLVERLDKLEKLELRQENLESRQENLESRQEKPFWKKLFS